MTGERHEDHIICGVFSFNKMKELYPSMINENDLLPNIWSEMYSLNARDFDFSGEFDASKITESQDSFNEYCSKFPETIFTYNVIQIVPDQTIPIN